MTVVNTKYRIKVIERIIPAGMYQILSVTKILMAISKGKYLLVRNMKTEGKLGQVYNVLHAQYSIM